MATAIRPGDFVRQLAPALWAAAGIARRLEGRVPNRPKLEEGTAAKQALTEADTSVQEALLATLWKAFPEVALEAEEDTPSVERFPAESDATVIIDPIDGTLHSYLEGRGPYAVIVGLAVREILVAGLVALPREGLLLAAARGEGACWARAGGPLRPARLATDGTRVLVSHSIADRVSPSLREAGWEPVPACGGALAVAPLVSGARAGLRHSAGPTGISVRGRVGALVSAEAGAWVRGGRGEAFPRDLYTPAPALLVAAAEADLEVLSRALEVGGYLG